MSGEISEIWIISDAGIPIFNRSQDTTVDVSLFGGFLSAIQSFVKVSFQEQTLEGLILGETKLHFLFDEKFKFFIVIRCQRNVADEESKKNLVIIRDLFISNYADKLQDKPFDFTKFNNFNNILNEELGEKIHAMEKTKWIETI